MEINISEKTPTICLNMIVKDESHIIRHTLELLCNKIHFSYWVICDTGSTDNTKQIIVDFFAEKEIDGELHSHVWKDFAHNRTLALNEAFNKTDLLFVFDADDEIHGDIKMPRSVDFDGYLLNFGASYVIAYQRILLINNRIHWGYKSVVHEYIYCLNQTCKITVLDGDYYVFSGRTGNRSKDPNKYLKDAEILKDAYYEAKKKDDALYLRYGFYCANSYRDFGDSVEAIKWYKVVLQNDNPNQEKYISCLQIFNIYNKIGEKESGFFYLVESFRYDIERYECIQILIQYYSVTGNPFMAYQYYNIFKDYYETKYLSVNLILEHKIFIEPASANILIPFYMILVANQVKETYPEANNTIAKMYEIIFTKKYPMVNDHVTGSLLTNLPLFFNICMERVPDFLILFQSYITFLETMNYSLYKYEFLKQYQRYGIKIKDLTAINTTPKFDKDSCKNSKNILFFSGFMDIPWNYTYSLKHALGGSETALANLAKEFPKTYNIYICGQVTDEKIDNVSYG